MNDGRLGSDQLAFYDENGYLLVRGLLDKRDLERWLQRLRQIIDGEVETAERMLIMRDVMIARGVVRPGTKAEAIAKLQDYENDPVLFSYVSHPRVLDVVEAFTGPDIKSIHTMLINKPPNVDGRHPLHQDMLYFPFTSSDHVVASWTALEPVTRENGCLVVVPRSHKGELLAHENPDWEHLNMAYYGAAGLGPDAERVHLEMEPGDTVFFHPILLHGSGRNRTQGFRRAISAHYASSRCRLKPLPGIENYLERRNLRLLRGREYEDCI